MDNAIRYRLNRPITYSWKDNNFFAYVGSDDLSHWGELTEYMTIIKSSKGKDASSAVVSMAQDTNARLVVIDLRIISKRSLTSLIEVHGFSIQHSSEFFLLLSRT